MEWVEVTGRTVEEAKKAALEQLGVAEADADFQVLSEAKTGLFGRLKEEARVRARVQPRYPRSKGDRRERRRSRASAGSDGNAATSRQAGSAGTGESAHQPAHGTPSSTADGSQPGASSGSRRRRRGPSSAPAATAIREGANFSEVGTASMEEQTRLAEEFLKGLLTELGSSATVSSHDLAEDVVELVIEGDNLGTLIGPHGATLLALQELTRTVLQHRVGSSDSRVVVDVNGYRKRRQDALARFAQQVAAEVRDTNTRRALEPMPPADRKVVHDAVNAIEGVTTTSEGEEPYRRVVLIPSPAGDEPGEDGPREDGPGQDEGAHAPSDGSQESESISS